MHRIRRFGSDVRLMCAVNCVELDSATWGATLELGTTRSDSAWRKTYLVRFCKKPKSQNIATFQFHLCCIVQHSNSEPS